VSSIAYRQESGEIYRLDHGTAYVGSIRPTGTGVEATLIYPAGRSLTVTFECALSESDRVAPAEAGTLLAVHVRVRASVLECRVLGTAGGSPRSFPITFKQSLALAEGGVHTVISVERRHPRD